MNNLSSQAGTTGNTLTLTILDNAINRYIQEIPARKKNVWLKTDLKIVETLCWGPSDEAEPSDNLEKESKYGTKMQCEVGGKTYTHPFPSKSLGSLISKPVGTYSIGTHRVRKKWSGDKDTSRFFILAGILAEYYYRVGYRTLNNGSQTNPILCDESVSYLVPLLKSLLNDGRESKIALSRFESSDTYAPTEKFKTDAVLFRQFFFVGPDYVKGNSEKDREHIKLHWNTKRLHSHAEEKLMQLVCPDDQNSLAERDRLIDSILTQATGIPLIANLNIPGKYLEFHDLLRQITRFESEEVGDEVRIIAKVRPPLPIITDAVLRPLYDNLKNKNYTGYDYILALGEIAAIAREKPNHSFSKEDLPKHLRTFVDDGKEFHLLIPIDEGKTVFKYRTKQHRLFVRAMAMAIQDTQEYFEFPFIERTNKELETLLIRSRKKEVQKGVAKAHYSGRAWFSVVYLEYLDSLQRKVLILELEKVANNFDTREDIRERQEKSLSIGSYLLLEKSTEYPKKFAEYMFLNFFGRTLYAAQAEMWPLLRESSGIFAEMAKKWFRVACLGDCGNSSNKDVSSGTIKDKAEEDANCVNISLSQDETTDKKQDIINPDRQPYFNFLQGDLYTDDELIDLPPSLQFAVKACKLQKITWYLTSEQERQSIQYNIVEEIFELLKSGLRKMEQFKSTDDMGYVIGVAMLLYSIANIMNRRTEFPEDVKEVKRKVQDASAQTILLKSILLSDYYSRRENVRYGKQEDACHIILGGIRVVCAMELSINERFKVKEYLESLESPDLSVETVKESYQQWIDFHLAGMSPTQCRPRTAFLTYRMLSYYDFGEDNTFEDFLKSKPNIMDLYKDFLPYDQMCGTFKQFFESPTTVWSDDAKDRFQRSRLSDAYS